MSKFDSGRLEQSFTTPIFYKAIYPIIIIVLVAPNRSHIVGGLTQPHLEPILIPYPYIASKVDTTVTNLHESKKWSHGSSDALIVNRQTVGIVRAALLSIKLIQLG